MTNFDDKHYINLVLQGNTNAFSILINEYKDIVFSLAMKMSINKEDAEEVAQDAFVKAYKSLNSFKSESKFSTWLYKITYNTCLDYLKKNKNQKKVIQIDTIIEAKVDNLSNAINAIELKKRRKIIDESLQLLPYDETFLLVLFYFDDQNINEIAETLGINSNNVKIKLHRSRKKLATILSTKFENEIIEYYEN